MRATASADEPSSVSILGRWAVLAAVLVAALVAFAVSIVREEEGPLPSFLGGPRPQAPASSAAAGAALLDVAGSGSNLPITRALAAAMPAPPRERAVVHDSIGSGGGVRAVLDGAIELALVSRPLDPTERELGLLETPYARVPVVVAVNESVVEEAIEPADLVAIFAGERTTWSDGSPIVVLMREPGDSSHKAVARVLPAFGEANERAWEDDRFRVLYRDDDMREAIAATVGAIGLFGEGALPEGVTLRALRIAGAEPLPETVSNGTYPFFKDLVFVSRGPPQGAAARFVEFTRSPEGRAIVQSRGALPLPEGEP